MDTKKEPKIRRLYREVRPGTVCLARWLERQGFSRDLQTSYRRGGWLEAVGRGAFKRPGEEVGWQGALYALQKQAEMPIHVGALTALAMRGFAHYVRLGGERVFLFSPRKTPLPAWFKKHDWHASIKHVESTVFPTELGLEDYEEKTFSLRISSPERAMLESLHLAPDEVDLVECSQVMDGLGTLRPELVQQLLTACSSVKAKRLFLYLAEKSGHRWLDYVDASELDLGHGHRMLTAGGVYVSKYELTVPRELVTP